MLFYTLDTLPILLAFLCYIVCHPGYLLPAGGPPRRVAAPGRGTVAPVDPEVGLKGQASQVQGDDSVEDQAAFKVSVIDA